MIGIYAITCRKNGKVYVGSSRQVSRRWVEHRHLLNAGEHFNVHLQRSWKKYGEEAFAFGVLEECEEDVLEAREKFWIKRIGSCFNVNEEPGKPPMAGKKMSAESCAKISAALKGRTSNRKGATLSAEVRAQMSKARRGRPVNRKGATMSAEARAKISESLKGNRFRRGKPASDESRAKMRESQLLRWAVTGGVSEETRKKLSENAKRQHASRTEEEKEAIRKKQSAAAKRRRRRERKAR